MILILSNKEILILGIIGAIILLGIAIIVIMLRQSMEYGEIVEESANREDADDNFIQRNRDLARREQDGPYEIPPEYNLPLEGVVFMNPDNLPSRRSLPLGVWEQLPDEDIAKIQAKMNPRLLIGWDEKKIAIGGIIEKVEDHIKKKEEESKILKKILEYLKS